GRKTSPVGRSASLAGSRSSTEVRDRQEAHPLTDLCEEQGRNEEAQEYRRQVQTTQTALEVRFGRQGFAPEDQHQVRAVQDCLSASCQTSPLGFGGPPRPLRFPDQDPAE